MLPRSRESALFEPAQGDEHRGRRHRSAGGLLEFTDDRRTVRAASQPLERQHDVVLEFTESPAHPSTPIKVAVIVCSVRNVRNPGVSPRSLKLNAMSGLMLIA
jgi:hypothetical protein